jgi:hypothetical protein
VSGKDWWLTGTKLADFLPVADFLAAATDWQPIDAIIGPAKTRLPAVSGRRRSQRLDGRDVEQGTDTEFGRNTFVGLANTNENIGSSQPGHFGMANLVALSTRHHESERLKRTIGQ